MTSTASSNPRQPALRNSSPPTRLRLVLLALTAAAFFLVPAAQAAAAEFALEVKITGTGEGGVGCKVNAGPLEECEPEYAEGTEVAVVAEPEPGSEFVAWKGECGTIVGGECKVKMNAKKTIEVVFDLEEFELTVETAGSGEGVVECQVDLGPYELCPESETYPYGTAVTLFAEPELGSEFVEWSGDCSGIEAECKLTIEEPLSVTATFKPEPPFSLTIETAGTGTGEVECEVESGPAEPCEAEYEEGTEVALVPKADVGSEFVEWSEDCTGSGACELTMDEDKTVTATFKLIPRTLTITKAGSGSGEVKCKFNGGGAGACTSPQPNGTKVELVATASAGSEFTGFSAGTGSAKSCSTSPCTFTIEANSSVTATFDLEPAPEEFALTVSLAGTGSGTVTSSPGSINCGIACSGAFAAGTEVTLTATPASGSTFGGWSGACTGTGACKVTMSQARSVTATFEKVPTPPPSAGTAAVARTAKVKGGKAQLKLTCKGEGACKGSLKLTAKIKAGGKTKNLTIGKAPFSLAAGASTTLKVKLSGPAKKALAKGPLKAKVGGTGVAASTVKLKLAK